MGKNLAFRFACSPKDRQQKISKFEPIYIGKIEKAFRANTGRGKRICEETAAVPFVSCEKCFAIAAKEWLVIPLLSKAMLLVPDIIHVNETMILIIQSLKTKLGNDVRFAQLRFCKT